MTIHKMTRPYLYGAYGSNLNVEQMQWRCPDAVAEDVVLLPDYKLIFRGVADCIESQGSNAPLGLWRITPTCEAALDIYEGYPRLYTKKFIRLAGVSEKIMIYVMNNADHVAPPSAGYLRTLVHGYRDFRFDPDYLREAVKHSYINETA